MTISIPDRPVTTGAGEEYDWDAEAALSLGGELPEWRLVVAPVRGIFHATELTSDGSGQTGGTVLGYVEARRDQQPIVAPWDGAIMEWLVQDGDPVGLGQPVARLLPHDADTDVPADAV
jgi:biotin carboxyl carrier protein